MLVILTSAAVATAVVAQSVATDQERRLLQERAGEAGQVLTGLVNGITASLGTVSAVTAATGNTPASFLATANAAASKSRFAYLALIDADGPQVHVRAAIGAGPPRGALLVSAASLAAIRAATPGVVAPTHVLRAGTQARLGWALAVPGVPGRVVYAETALRPFAAADSRSRQPSQVFGELDGALYAGPTALPAQLVLATTRELPMHGPVQQQLLAIGPTHWLLLVASRQALMGPLAQGMPLIVLVLGLFTAVLVTVLAEVLGRRRSYALQLVAHRTTALEVSLADLREAKERFQLAFDHAPVGMCLVGLAGEFLQVNPALCRLLGRSEEALRTQDLHDVVHAEDWAESGGVAVLLGSGKAFEQRYPRRNGEIAWGRLAASAVTGTDGVPRYYVVQVEDVTQARAAESQLTYRALHDALTGLPNRTLVTDRIASALARRPRRPTELAVLFLDLDGFKLINDGLGHEPGDRVLVEIAQRLATAVRPGDTVARFGGDEFVILCEEIDGTEEAEAVARRVAAAISLPISFGGHELCVTASIGIVTTKSARHSPANLLRDADTAMYRAKQNGKARYEVFDEGLRRLALRRIHDETTLRRALRDETLRMHYQPIVDVTTGRTSSFEALLRYDDPHHGLVLPPGFIPVAEESGLIAPLGAWVLKQACRDAAGWQHDLGPNAPRVAVNVSARQAARADFFDTVTAALAEAHLEPRMLCLELTETALMEAGRSTLRCFERLRDLGIEIGIDDFGTGYSSLAYVKRLPVSFLKVDQSFVAGIVENADDRAIVTAIVRLGQALGLRTVAEGIETAAQLDLVRDLGCQLAQGFHLGRPQAASVYRGLVPAQRGPDVNEAMGVAAAR